MRFLFLALSRSHFIDYTTTFARSLLAATVSIHPLSIVTLRKCPHTLVDAAASVAVQQVNENVCVVVVVVVNLDKIDSDR